MAHRSRRKIYETAFDSKVEKKADEGSGDLLDRIANHPILQLLNPRRRSRISHQRSTPPFSSSPSSSKLRTSKTTSNLFSSSTSTSCSNQTSHHKAKFQAGGTPRFGRRGARSRVCPPTRSLSSHHITSSNLRPIGLSKSDDQILNSVTDSLDDEDCLEDYVEGQQAEDLARDLITLHISADTAAAAANGNTSCHSSPYTCSSPHMPHRRHRRVAQRGMSVDARISGWCASYNDDKNVFEERSKRNKTGSSTKSSSIMALHHPNVNSPRMKHLANYALCSPQLQHITGGSPHQLSYHSQGSSSSIISVSSSPRFGSRSSNSSPKVYHSSASPSPRLLHDKSLTPRHAQSAVSSPKLYHLANTNVYPGYSSTSTSNGNKSPPHLFPNANRKQFTRTAAISRVLQTTCDSNSAPSIHTFNNNDSSKLSIDEPSTSGYSSNKFSHSERSTSNELDRAESLAKLKPLELHTPPGTAPLPVKFIKKTPLTDQSPSSWFSPPRQKDLNLPIKRSSQSRSSSSDASTSENIENNNKVRFKKSNPSSIKQASGAGISQDACYLHHGAAAGNASSGGSQNSLNSSMEVLMDTASQQALSLPAHVNVKSSSFSLDSMVSGGSSLESLKSSMSEGCKSIADTGGNTSGNTWRNMGSNTSLPLRPSLLLPAPHRSLIQSAKFQILSPISDKSQEPSSTDTGGPIVGGPMGCGFIGGGSQNTSPQDLIQQTPLHSRNIHEDFRNVHHILPGPEQSKHCGKGSDSGISIEYVTQSKTQSSHSALKDLPFDMPKLRRRLAAARSCPSTSNSSLTSSGERSYSCLGGAMNPAISRLQAGDCRSGTSSSNSSDWDVQSSATSSNEGTPKRLALARESLALDLGCKAMATTGEKIDITLPITKQSWYHGKINRAEAENLLRSESEGSYLVRSIDTPRREYSLALKASCGFMHLKIQYIVEGKVYKIGRGNDTFPSVPHIIYHHSIHRLPIKGAEHMFLLKPVISETL